MPPPGRWEPNRETLQLLEEGVAPAKAAKGEGNEVAARFDLRAASLNVMLVVAVVVLVAI